MFVLEYNCQKESEFMNKMIQNKFLMGVTVIFLISLYIIAGIQTNIEAKDETLNKEEISLNYHI